MIRRRKRKLRIPRRRRTVLRAEWLEDRRLLAGMEMEPNDVPAEANPLVVEESTVVPGLFRGVIEGAIDAGESDFFEFTALAGERVSVSVNAADGALDPYVFLRNAAGGQLASDRDGGPGQNSLLSTYEIASSGTYLVEVRGDSSTTTGNYELIVLATTSLSMESDRNYANDRLSSNPDPLNFSVSGNVLTSSVIGTVMASEGTNSDEDAFILGRLNTGTSVSLAIRTPQWSTVSPLVEIVNSNGDAVTDSDNDPGVFTGTIATDDSYYARVSASNGAGPHAQYALDVTITDSVAPVVNEVTRLPPDGETTTNLLSSFAVTFSEKLAVDTVIDSALDLRGAGADGNFDTSDDVLYDLGFTYEAGDLDLDVVIQDGPLADGDYRLTIGASITDVVGNALGGGSGYTQRFSVDAVGTQFVFEGRDNETIETATALALTSDTAGTGLLRTEKDGRGSIDPSDDVDYYKFVAEAGDWAAITVTPFGSLSSYVSLRGPDGSAITADSRGGPDNTSFISGVELSAAGEYFVEVSRFFSSMGDYQVRVDLSRDAVLETDASYANDTIGGADPLAFTTMGTTSTASIGGTIMSTTGSNTDEDTYALGLLNSGTSVTLASRVPSWSSLASVVQLIDSDGNVVSDTETDPALFSGTIAEDGMYYARVSASAGAGSDAQYVLDVTVADLVAPVVNEVTRLPADSETTTNLLSSFAVMFSEKLAADTVIDSALDLRGAGADGNFDTSDDVLYDLEFTYEAGDLDLDVVIHDGPLADGDYRLTIGASITDVVGNALGGGSGYAQRFSVDAVGTQFVFEGRDNETIETATALALTSDTAGTGLLRTEKDGRGSIDPSDDVDYYKFVAEAGDWAAITVTPFGSRSSYVSLRRSDGSSLATDVRSGPDNSSLISGVELSTAGEYFVSVSRYGDTGDYQVRVDLSRDVALETDASYANDRIGGADPLTFTTMGTTSTASIGGTIMSTTGSNTDEDTFALGLLNPGTSVTLASRVPSWSSLASVVQLIDADGNVVSDTETDPALFSGTIAEDGMYYARVSASAGTGLDAQYVLDVTVADLVAPVVDEVTRLPADGETTTNLLSSFAVTFSEKLAVDTVIDSALDLRGAGADGNFDTSDDVLYDLGFTYEAGDLDLDVVIQDGPLADGDYRLTIGASVTDVLGNALDGDTDGTAGGDFVRAFSVQAVPDDVVFEGRSNGDFTKATPLTLRVDSRGTGWYRSEVGYGSVDPDTDEDWWTFEGAAGDHADVWAQPEEDAFTPYLRLYRLSDDGADVVAIASDFRSGPGNTSYISDVELPSDGTYFVQVQRGNFEGGDYDIRVNLNRSADIETDQNYGNDSAASADAIQLVEDNEARNGVIVGTVMAGESGNVDEDYFNLGQVEAGETILARVQTPTWSELEPLIEIRDAAGTVVSVNPVPTGSDVARFTAMQSGLFYAVVVGLDGEGVLGQYRLDVTISDELTIADLVASEIDLPSPPMAGDEITISWTVGNYGTAATDVDRWSDRVILSANKTIGDFDDIVLGNAVRTGALDPEQTYTAQVTTTLSERLAGDYHVFVQTDFRNDLFEFTLDDNNLSEAASLLTIAPPPLPDLVVASDSISAPASIDPTEAFDVSWVTSNEGAVGATGTWEERLYLSDSASGEKRQLLGTFVFEEDLAAGQSSTVRTNSIQLPPGSFAGDVYFVVEVDAADIVFESRENNRFVSSTSSSVPRLLSLDVSSSELTEGDSARRVTLTRNGATATPLTVRLAADDASQLGMPSEVIIPAWRSSTQFLVSANEDGIVDGNANVTLTASADGFTSADASLSVIDTDIPAITTTVSAEQLNEGDAATLNIRYNGLAGSDFVVRLSADSRSELQLPAVVTIPAGQNTLDIPFEVIDDEVFEGIESVTIESKAAGYVRGRARVAIAASDVPVLTLDLMPTTTEGSSDALGTVSIPVARQEPISISLATSQPSALFVLPTVTIPAGARSAQFSFIALENDQVDGERDVEITATPRPDFNSSPITPAAVSGSIRLLDNDGPTLTARLDRGLVSETGTAILTVSRNTDTALAMSVSLSSSDDTELSVPATLTIPAGLASAEVTVSGLEDDAVDGDQSVLVTAFAAGFNSGVASIVISDSNLPDLVPTSITAPAEVSPNARSTIQWSTSNQGIAPVTAGWTERIYLSADRLPGDDSLLAEYSFAGSLSVDVTNERSVPVLFPATPGEFWLVIEVDANERVREGLEANNFFVSPTPVFIQAPYTATVSADIDSASTGTPVTLTGSATNQDGSPAAFVDVAVTVTVRGTQRVLDARTDAAGNFEAIFTPLPGEGGRYTVAAAHPAISDSPSQDEFLLLGLQPIAGFDFIGLTVGSTTTETIRIRNLADVELSGLAVETVGVASGLSVTPTIASSDLGAFESFELSYDLTDSGAALGESQFILRITTNEAPSLEIPIAVNVMPVAAALFVDSETITTGMVVGEQTSIEFVIENRGGGDSGPIALLLPSGTPWLAVASGRTIENIVAGESAAVTLLLTPSLDLELTEYRGRMIASSDTSEVAINFNFRAVAETVGDLRVTVVDELFYFADDAPTVQGASVELRDPITRELIATSAGAANGAEGETAGSVSISDDGSVEFRGVPRGKYLVEVSSDEHDPSELLLTVPAGGLAEEQVFISRNFVEYTWNVEEIEVEDRTRVTIDATFETNVPAPVVVVESNIDLFGLDNPGDTRTFEIKYTNEGFIQAEDVQLFFESHPLYEIVPLVDVIPVLPARSSASIPVRITRRALPPGGAEGEFVPSIPGIDCYIYAYTTYRYVCGPFEIFKQVPIPVLNVGAGCAVGGFGGFGGGFSGGGSIGGGASGGGSGSTFGGGRRGFGSGGRPFVFGVSTPKVGSSPPDCQECEVERWELTLGGSGMLDTLLERAGRLVERSGVVKDVKISVEGSAGIETCCEDDVQSGYKLDAGGSASVSASFQFFIIGGKTKPVKLPPLNGYDVTVEIEAGVSISGSISGSLSGSVGNTCDAFLDFSGCASGGLTGSLTGAIGGGLSFTFSKGDDIFSVSAEGSLGIKASANAGLTLCIGEDDSEGWNVTLGKVVAFGELGAEVSQDLKDKLGITNDVGFSYRIEETIFEGVSWSSNDQEDTTGEGETNGSSAEQTLVFNGLADFFDIDSLGTSLGFESNDALAAALGEPGLDFAAIPPDEVQAFIQRVAEVATPDRNGQGVCAEVRLQIQQDVVQNRQAFSASLELLNGHFSSIESIRAGIQIEDRTGNNAEHLFAIETIELVGLGSLEGDSSLGQGDEATITWLIVPTQAAALTSPADYFVSGFFSYTDGGSQVEVPLAPAIITVTPQPALDLDYFLQRDVISDDPFTDEIEPAEIFTLGVQVQNRGVGTAKDLRIESAQPKIIENEKGLLIDFEIVGTSVNGEPAERTLTALIGDLPGGELAIAEWQLESTLQGLFTEYEASFEHISDFGSPELSLIKSVEIHELIRAVQATASGIDDSLTDFLVNDIPDPQDSPDSLYLSDGSVVDVQLGSNGQFDSPASFSNLVVNVTASMPTGWAYVNLTDPSDGEFQLVGVRRSDGTLLDPSNFWQTDRTFIGLGLRPLYENKVHLLDFDSTGKYEFIFSNGDLTGPGVERFTGVDPNPTARAIGHIDVRFDELIDPASLDISDVTLLKNGVAVPTAGITVLTGSNPLVRIGGLGTLTEEDAVYELQVDLAGVRDFVGNRGEGLESIIWVKGEAAPAVIALTGLPDEFSTSPISMFQLRVTEPVQLASLLGAVSLLHDGVSVDVGGASITEVENGLYEISGLESLTSTDGDYELTLDATALLDLDGNAGIGQRSHAWQLDATPPRITAVFAPPTNPRNIVVQRVDVEFSEAIDPSSLTVDDVMLIRDGGTENLLAGEGRVTVEDRGNNIYRIGGINWVQAFIADPQIADFTFSIDAAAVRDFAGNAGIGSESTTWTIDLVSPVAPENLAVAVEELPEGAGEESPNAVFSGTAFEPELTLVVENEFTGDELFRGRLTDTDFAIPLRLPAEGRNELSGRLIDIAGNTTDFDLPNAFVTSLPPIVTETAGFTPRIRRTTIDQFTLTFAKPVAADSFTADVLSLQRDGSHVGVPESVVIETSADRRMFTVSGLGDATFEEGEYRLSVDLRLLRGADGVRGTGTYTEAWTLDRTPPTTRVVSTLLESTTRRYFVSVESDAATPSLTEVSEFTVFAVSPNSPLARVARLDPETPGTEFEGDLDEEYVFFSDSLDAAGNRQPLTLASTGGFPITLDAAKQTDLPNDLIVAEGTTVQFSGEWSVELPEVVDGGFRHRIKISDRMLNVRTSTPWQNPVLAQDVNHSGIISPLDALIIINRLNSEGPGTLSAPTSMEGVTEFFYLDANGDHSVSPIDVLQIINLLNDRTGSGEGEPPVFQFDPRFLATEIHSPIDRGSAQGDSVDIAIQSLTTGPIPQRETPVQDKGIVSDVEEKDLVAAIDEFFGKFGNEDPLTLANI